MSSDIVPNIKNKNMKTILRLFPYLADKSKASELKIDQDSIHYISVREHAEQISNIIVKHIKKIGMDPTKTVITDAMAGVGGNTLNLAAHVLFINAIEIDKQRAEYLQNNINVYELDNIKVYNQDCINILGHIETHNVVYLDPVWGKHYKIHKSLRLNVGNHALEDLCIDLFESTKIKKNPEIIVVKLPTNYDIINLYNKMKGNTIYLYDLIKMYIIVMIRPKK